jgi:ribosome maturation factor RimP
VGPCLVVLKSAGPQVGARVFFWHGSHPLGHPVMATTLSSTVHGVDREALLRVVEPIAHAHGAELVEVEFRPERGGWVLRVFVEKRGAAEHNLSTRDAAVTLELCANVSRDLSPALDVADLIPHAYHLEVSSPGVERPLKGERDFVRFAGQKAKVKLRRVPDGMAGPRVIVGTLDGVAGNKIRIIEGRGVREVPLADVDSARLIFEFGTPAVEPRRG